MRQLARRPIGTVVLVLACACTAAPLAVEPPAATALVRGVVRGDGRPRRDVVVWLEGARRTARPEPAVVTMDQRNLAFLPHVLAVAVGTRVEMPNNDRVFHNVFSFKDGKRFDLGLYPSGTAKSVTFDRPGVSRLFCNIHPAMAGYVVAVDADFFAVTDADGRFEMPDVPEGAVTYHAWRAGEPVRTGPYTVGGGVLTIEWP
ncbi:MAG: plastocyanin/azurin family copper-binding protein [Vicinamibacterales bacterium]